MPSKLNAPSKPPSVPPTRWLVVPKADSADYLDDEKEPTYAEPLFSEEDRRRFAQEATNPR